MSCHAQIYVIYAALGLSLIVFVGCTVVVAVAVMCIYTKMGKVLNSIEHDTFKILDAAFSKSIPPSLASELNRRALAAEVGDVRSAKKKK
ncbi:hypothetical protein AAVH_03483 [Aphelenchoides avenae]|nr:hypothetical protein AAVH_03483 [Aphelenchus avenae]